MATTYHRLAWKEFARAINWYRQRSKRAAARFIDGVFKAEERIDANPLQWPAYAGNYRWLKVDRFPYLLFYLVLPGGDTKIMAVAHGSRRPGYWRRRRP
jgi:toxin ParE1/3/4